MSNFAAKLVNNHKMEEVIAIIVTILGSVIYAYLESSYNKRKERKAAATRPSTAATRRIPAVPQDTTAAPVQTPAAPILPEEGQRVTHHTAAPTTPAETPRHTSHRKQLQLQRWRRALIDREILTPKYH